MRSKTSKQLQTKARSLWREARDCSEEFTRTFAQDLARELLPHDRVILEGEMGAGKTTFARALLLALGVKQPPEGSPTFAIAHEYNGRFCDVIHIDLYRLKSEAEVDDAGVPGYFWESEAIVICEWLSMFPDFEEQVLKSSRNWVVKIDLASDPARRSIRVHLLKN